jgi:hypothetical protein
MSTADLASITRDLLAFANSARRLSTQITPLLRRGTAVNHGTFNGLHYRDGSDAILLPHCSAPLQRIHVVLGDVIHIAGSATVDLVAALAAHPELVPAPPDVPIAEPVEPPPAVKARRAR